MKINKCQVCDKNSGMIWGEEKKKIYFHLILYNIYFIFGYLRKRKQMYIIDRKELCFDRELHDFEGFNDY